MKIKKMSFGKNGVETFLSPLEADVLRTLWKKDQAKVRELHVILKEKRKVALTSVAVILDRLHKKRLVKRTAQPGRGGHHYIYSPSRTKSDFEHNIMESVVDKMIATFGSSAVNYFNERFSKNKVIK
jgi:predicted transcriptional regulator